MACLPNYGWVVTDTLNSRLGYSSEARLVIIAVDGMGSTHAATAGCYDSLRHGLATSGRLMVPGPWARAAAADFRGEDALDAIPDFDEAINLAPDYARAYVFRSNGAAIPRSSVKRIEPGDAIVVPSREVGTRGFGRAFGSTSRFMMELAAMAALIMAATK